MTNNTGTVTLYKISATACDANGVRVPCNTPEVLGDCYSELYVKATAVEASRDLLIEDCDADVPMGTEYDVAQVLARISDVRTEAEDDALTVTAIVQIDGSPYDTKWTARDSVSYAGLEGLEPAGDSVDCWIDGGLADYYGTDIAVAIGLEILAIATR